MLVRGQPSNPSVRAFSTLLPLRLHRPIRTSMVNLVLVVYALIERLSKYVSFSVSCFTTYSFSNLSQLLPSLIPGTVSTRLQQAPVPFLLSQIHSLDPACLPAPLGPNDVTTPLKHLAVLADYTAQLTDGSYPPIDHATLTNLLLEPDPPQTDAFQTAMGLVFLSRLGLQWE